MPSTTFIDGTSIEAPWMNDVNDVVYDILGNGTIVPATKAAARDNLGLEIGVDIPSNTGTGASGTWGIDITGNAATATSATSATSATTATTATTATNQNGGTVSATSFNGGQLAGMRNKIINGKMELVQRGTSFVSPSSAAYTADRWTWGNTSAGVVTITQQTADSPTSEFRASLRVAVTTADASLAAGDLAYIGQRIEGYDVRDLIGKDFTISFWVRSSKTGTHSVAIRNSASDRSYVKTYTVSAANTWEQKSLTLSGGLITAGTWDWTTGVGLFVDWVLAAGTTYQTTADAWQTGTFFGVSGLVNCLDTIGNIFAITGVQIEVGTRATPFEHRPYSLELSLAQRYFCVFNAVAGAAYSTAASSAAAQTAFYYPVTMRTTPTVVAGTSTLVNATDAFFGIDASSGYYVVTQGAGAGNYNGRRVGCTASAEL